MEVSAPRWALGVAAGIALVLSVSAPAFAAEGDQWWSDVYELDAVHKTTDGSGVTVCVIDGAINTGVREFDGAKLKLKAAVTEDFGPLTKAKSHPTAPHAIHGTSMAALIIGQGKGNGPGGTGISGVAPGATVNFYQGDADPKTLDYGASDFSMLIDRGIDDGCTLFSISVSGIELDDAAFDQINKAGAVVVVGDQASSSQSKDDGTVVVGAADQDGKPWADDAQPKGPDVIAPGVKINSGNNDGVLPKAHFTSDSVNSGSSDATAITAGLLALVKSKYPDATGNQLIQALIHSQGGAKDWSATPKDGWGTVRLADMLERDPSGWPDVNPMLMDRQTVFDTFPESVWKDPSAPAAEEDDKAANAPVKTAAKAQPDDGGIPVWVWPTGGVVLVAAAGAAIIARRRTSDTTTTTTRTGA